MEYDPDPCLLALSAFNTGMEGGLLAETSTGVVTDTSWKCSTVEETNWHLTSFDDSGWDNARIVQPHGGLWFSVYPSISLDADWIWANVAMAEYTTTYCRKRLC